MKIQELIETKQRLDPKCWKGYKKQGTKMKGDTRVNNCVPESAEQGVAEGQLDEIDRRGFLKGMGAAAVAGAAGSAMAQNQSGRVAGLRAKLAREVGVLDVDSKNYDNISGAPKLFLFAENGSNFIMQWIDKEGNELGEPIIFGAGKNATDARGNQITMFFGPKIAVKIQGDYIFVTPRSWIENKIGWQYAYSEVPNIFAMMKRESVNQGVAEGLDAGQKKARQVPGTEMPKKTSPVLGKAPKQHPFKGRAVGDGL